jgi:hypothetical protein
MTHNTGTVVAARDDARAQAGRVAEAMPYLPASATPYPPAGVDPAALTWAETVASGGYTHKVLARGTRIQLADVTGEACAHVLLYNADQPWERLNAADTVKIPWQAYLGQGHPLLSGDGRVLATITEDNADGHHDAFCGTGARGRELLALAAAKHDLTLRDLPPSVSFFQGVRIDADGATVFTGGAGPAASVELLAELPLIVLIANVPHPVDPRPEPAGGPLRVHAWKSEPTGPGDPYWDTTPEAHRAYLNTADYAAARGI